MLLFPWKSYNTNLIKKLKDISITVEIKVRVEKNSEHIEV